MNLVWFQKVVGQVTETEVTEFSVLMRLLYSHCEILSLTDCMCNLCHKLSQARTQLIEKYSKLTI